MIEFYQVIQPHFLGQLIQLYPAYDLGPHLGKESFIAGGEGLEKKVGSDGIQDGIAEKFQPLVIDFDPVGSLFADGLVQESQLV